MHPVDGGVLSLSGGSGRPKRFYCLCRWLTKNRFDFGRPMTALIPRMKGKVPVVLHSIAFTLS